ncbi:hypothetical protein JZ751_011279 [Albula glossodonta]|uniref:Uncharacterized protein n=1 Tax=Albula glossodonta TaxID=121402 RepID=A0A8T2P7J5_9TELE|nr:hypothetical protein JZ751_011279 [Albula glossodonta]
MFGDSASPSTSEGWVWTGEEGRGCAAQAGGGAGVGNHTGRIKVVFTPTICKVTCNGRTCKNNCEKGNTTTIISENGHATDTLTAPNFRVGLVSSPWRDAVMMDDRGGVPQQQSGGGGRGKEWGVWQFYTCYRHSGNLEMQAPGDVSVLATCRGTQTVLLSYAIDGEQEFLQLISCLVSVKHRAAVRLFGRPHFSPPSQRETDPLFSRGLPRPGLMRLAMHPFPHPARCPLLPASLPERYFKAISAGKGLDHTSRPCCNCPVSVPVDASAHVPQGKQPCTLSLSLDDPQLRGRGGGGLASSRVARARARSKHRARLRCLGLPRLAPACPLRNHKGRSGPSRNATDPCCSQWCRSPSAGALAPGAVHVNECTSGHRRSFSAPAL